MKKTASLLTILLSLLFSNQLCAVPVIINGLKETNPPTLQSSSPADNATNVTLSQNFTLTFDKDMMVGTGFITIKKTSDNSIFEALDVTDVTLLTISNTVVTLNPSGILEKGTGYYVEIDASALRDNAGNSFEGFTGATTLNFTTVDVVINEVVTDPQIDWSTNGFDGTDGAKTVSGGVDEFVELFIKSAGIDFTGWTIELNDGSNVSGDLTRTGAFDAITYTGTGTTSNTGVGDYLVLGNVDGSGAMNNTRLVINLKDPGGAIVDAVAIGGGDGQAPSGNAASAADESVQRFINGLDTDTDNSDFTKGPVTMGAANTGPSVTLTQSTTTLAEADGVNTITATLSAASSQTTTVEVGIKPSGSATIINDFTLSTTSIVITAGNTFGTATLTAVSDLIDEDNETITVEITGVANGSEDGTQEVTSDITDDDIEPVVTLSVDATLIVEAGGSSAITATLSAISSKDVTVTLAYSGIASSGVDYNNTSSTSIVITAGNITASAAVGITAIQDANSESNETIIIDIEEVTNGSENGVQQQTVTITDDDTPNVAFISTSSAQTESAASANLGVGLNIVSGLTVTVDYVVTGTATGSGIDYTLNNGTLTFNPASNFENITIASIVDDATLEANETVIVTLSNPVNANLGANTVYSYTIIDNDEASITIADVSGNENDGAITLTATLDNAVQGGFTVDLNTADGTATIADHDYAAISDHTLTFIGTAGETRTFTVTPTIDIKLEADETIIVSQDNLAATSLGVVITDGAVLTVTNDDVASVTIADVSGNENDGAITLSATLDNAVQGGFTVDVNTADGTATIADNDYAVISGQTLTFTGIAGETQTFTVTPIADTKDENNETITIRQSNLASTSLGITITDGATVNVINDDIPPVIFFGTASDAQSESEGAQDLPISLSALSSKTVTVDYAASGTAAGGGTDYTFDNGTITFNPGDMNLMLQLTGIIDDLLDEENETIILTLSNPINATLGAQTILTYTIFDNDAEPTITLSVSSNAIAEAAGSSTIMATLSTVSGREVTVNLSYSGTAVSGTDYNNDASPNITISAGQLSAVAAIGITATDDSSGESAETVIIDIQSVSNGIENGVQQQTISIIDDDDSMAPSGYAVNFGDDLIGASEAGTTKFTFSGAEVGATYNYTVSSSGGGINVAETGKVTTATDQITLADLSSLGDGTLTLSVTLTDSSSNVGFEAIDTTVLDQTTPSVPVVTRVSSDSGSNDADAITNDNTPNVNGTSDANSSVEVFFDGSSIGTTTADGSGNWTLVYTGSSTKSDGTIAITAKSTDGAGNTSTASTALLLIIDTIAPLAPAITSISTDSGVNGTDEITNDPTLIFTGSAEANSTVEVFIDAASLGSVIADGTGNWGFDHTGSALADGNYCVTASASDIAGNTSTESIALGIIVDTVVPSAPIVDLAAASDLGVSNSDDLTSDNTPTIEGTADANALIELFVDEVSVGTTMSDDTGSWRLTPDSTILNGVISLTARATDAAGNTSASSNNLSITIDTNIANPTLSPVDNAIDILPDANLIITFSEDVNKGKGNITLKKSSDQSILETIDVTANTANISGGVVTITLENNKRAPGTAFYIIIESGTFTDDAGNDYKGISGITDWSFTSIPASAVSSVIVPTATTYSIGDSLEFTVNMVLPVTITGEVTIPVTIGSSTINATQVGVVSNSSSILFRYTVLEGELDLDGIAVGTAMNLNGGTMKDQFDADAILTLNNVASASKVLIDGVRPRPTLSATGSSLINKSYVTTFKYDEPVIGFELTDISVTNGIASNLTQVIAGTKWRADITPIVDGGVSVTLAAEVAKDTLGNTSVLGNSVSKTFDGTKPEVTSITRIDADHLNTGITSVKFRIVFSENVLGVDLTDFEVALKGTVGVVNAMTQVDAKTYDVTVNGISGEGAIGLNLKDDDSIIDNAANTLGGAGLSNGDFTGDVYTTNLLPRDIDISTVSIFENNFVGDIIGALSSTDADIEDVHTYAIVSGTGDTDNGSFTIEGTDLKAAEVFDFETKESYSLRIKTDDGNGGAYEHELTIAIDNVLEASIFVTGDASFDVSEIGRSHKRSLTLTNNGEKTVEIRVASTPAGFSAIPGALILAIGASAEVVLTFIPTEVRTYNGDIIFNHEGGNEAHPVSGEGEIITSVEDRILKSTEILIFPNPVERLVTLDLAALNGSKLDIEIVNVMGVSMFTKEGFTEMKLVLDVSAYESGIYIVLFNNGRSVARKKVMINR